MPKYKYQGDGYQHQEHQGTTSVENTERLIVPMLAKKFFDFPKNPGVGIAILDYVVQKFQITNAYNKNSSSSEALFNHNTRSVLVVDMGFLGVRRWNPTVNSPHNFFEMYDLETNVFDGEVGYDTRVQRSFGESGAYDKARLEADINMTEMERYFKNETDSAVPGIISTESQRGKSAREKRDLREAQIDFFIDVEKLAGKLINRCLNMVPILSENPGVSPPNVDVFKLDCSLPNNTGSMRSGTTGTVMIKNQIELEASGRALVYNALTKGPDTQMVLRKMAEDDDRGPDRVIA